MCPEERRQEEFGMALTPAEPSRFCVLYVQLVQYRTVRTRPPAKAPRPALCAVRVRYRYSTGVPYYTGVTLRMSTYPYTSYRSTPSLVLTQRENSEQQQVLTVRTYVLLPVLRYMGVSVRCEGIGPSSSLLLISIHYGRYVPIVQYVQYILPAVSSVKHVECRKVFGILVSFDSIPTYSLFIKFECRIHYFSAHI